MEYNKQHPLRVFEAFCGYGAQSLALERLKHDFPDFDYKVIGISDVEMNALAAYRALHGDIPNYGDIQKIDWAKVENFDLLTWSSPCQSISSAGLQRGMKRGSGTRSSLIWSIMDCLEVKRPKFLLMENVKALLSNKFKQDFLNLLGYIEDFGYKSYYDIMDASRYGVPQHRERVFCISILNDGSNQTFNFPKPFPLTRTLGDVLEKSVDDRYYLTEKSLAYFSRVTDDKSHNHNFNPKKKLIQPSLSGAGQEAVSTTTSSSNGNYND